MNGVAARIRRRSVPDIANELCDLFALQFDRLQQGLAEDELEEYLERRKRIHQLQSEMEASVSRPS